MIMFDMHAYNAFHGIALDQTGRCVPRCSVGFIDDPADSPRHPNRRRGLRHNEPSSRYRRNDRMRRTTSGAIASVALMHQFGPYRAISEPWGQHHTRPHAALHKTKWSKRVDLNQCTNNRSSRIFVYKEDDQMLAILGGQKRWSPIQTIRQWCQNWTEGGSPLRCCGEETVERIARDVGVSAPELRRLASLGPESADLLLRRMEVLDLDRSELSQTTHRLGAVRSAAMG